MGGVEEDWPRFEAEGDDTDGVEVAPRDNAVIRKKEEEGARCREIVADVDPDFRMNNVFVVCVCTCGDGPALGGVLVDEGCAAESVEGMAWVECEPRASYQLMRRARRRASVGSQIHRCRDATVKLEKEVLRKIVRNRVEGRADPGPDCLDIALNSLGMLFGRREGEGGANIPEGWDEGAKDTLAVGMKGADAMAPRCIHDGDVVHDSVEDIGTAFGFGGDG
jgi:hypothetical protein